MRSLYGVLFLVSAGTWAACPDYPKAHDLEKLEYTLDKLSSSYRVVLEFPTLSTHASCSARDVQWGRLWEFEIDKTDPVKVTVYDLNKVRVQEFGIYGPMDLKVTSNRAAFRFYSALTTKALSDHRLLSVELHNDAPLRPLPTFEVDDGEDRKFVSGAATLR